jgi:hypothetical protein
MVWLGMPYKQDVGGSSPSLPTKYFNHLAMQKGRLCQLHGGPRKIEVCEFPEYLYRLAIAGLRLTDNPTS